MSKFWSSAVRNTEPYVPGEQPQDQNVIKLNTNENPYPPSPRALEAMRDAVNSDLRKYPSPTVSELREVIARREGVNPDNVFVGNGSDEVLAFSFQAFFECNEAIKFPSITYSFYPVYARLYNIPYQEVPLLEDFSIDVDALSNSIGGVIFPNPNAPTGKELKLDDIEKITSGNPNSVVIVDEAYVDFGAKTAVPFIKKYSNLLVTRTLSKSHALAGIRLGYAIGQVELIEGLERIKNSFNSYTINRLTLAGAVAALEDHNYYDKIIEQVIQTRERTSDQLEQLGFEVINSKANFLFVRPAGISAQSLYTKLKDDNIFIRYFNRPDIDQYVRISVGTEEEMEKLIHTIAQIIRK